MRRHLHVAVPPEPWAVGAGDRNAADVRIDDGGRLHDDRGPRWRALAHDGPEQRRLEGQNPVAVARGSFREKHDRVALLEPRHDLVGGVAGRLPARAIDEDDRCKRASAETKGQPPTSNLATNETGASADSTGMSSQDV